MACTGDYLQTRVTIGRDDGGRGGQQSAGEEGEGQPLGMMVTGHWSLVCWCCHVMQCVAAAGGCLVAAWYSARVSDILFTLCFVLPEPGPAASQETEEEETGQWCT